MFKIRENGKMWNLFSLLLVCVLGVAVAGPKSVGHVNSLSGKCFESDGSGFTCDAGPETVVWDPDAPCGDGSDLIWGGVQLRKAYIHAAPNAGSAPMTAGAGKTVHTYFSATVKNPEQFASLVGTCAQSPVAIGPTTSWQVADARAGENRSESLLLGFGNYSNHPHFEERIRSCTLKGYTSGALPVQLITWTCDESLCLELLPGVGVVVHDGDLMDPTDPEDDERVIPEPNVANFLIAPKPQKDASWVAVYVPQSSMVARVSLYHLSKPSKIVMELNLPNKVKDCQMLWNFDGSALLANAMSDVDETGNSYFGSTYLYWLKPEDRKKLEVCGVDKGLVQDLAWSPCSNEFMVIVGMLPAEVNLYNGTTGKLEKSLGKSKRNTLKWNPFGRFAAVAGFGTLPGDLDFYDRSKDETVASLRAALTVDCSWFADGRHFMAATVAPRMNEGNQITVYKYTGDPVLKMEFKPDFIEGRHEDTGAGARTKTQALLFAARWRPDGEKHQERAASPPRAGEKRVKGLPVAAAPGTGYTPQANAYRPRNAESGAVNTVAAMMRGEVAIPEGAPRERTEPWEVKPVAAPLEAHEVRKMEKEAKKLAEQKEKEAKEKHQQALRELVQDEKDAKKRIKELKAELEELEKLKDKEFVGDGETDGFGRFVGRAHGRGRSGVGRRSRSESGARCVGEEMRSAVVPVISCDHDG
eukprot:s105_g43.t1